MICDGHNVFGMFEGHEIVYRPLRARHRRAIAEELRRLPKWSAQCIEREIAESRLVFCDFDSNDVFDMNEVRFEEIWRIVMGTGNDQQEQDDETNLHRGVYCLARWPHFEKRNCGYCCEWLWNPLTGKTAVQQQGGPPLPRHGTKLCDLRSVEWSGLSKTACPRGHWSHPNDLSEKNRLAYRHYQACEAAGQFPDDLIVLDNARIIRHAARLARSDQTADGRASVGGCAAGQLHAAARSQRRAT